MTGIIYHRLFGEHLQGYNHVERPERYEVIMERLRNCPFSGELDFIEAESADARLLELVHDAKYVNDILSMNIDSPVVLDWGAVPHAVNYMLEIRDPNSDPPDEWMHLDDVATAGGYSWTPPAGMSGQYLFRVRATLDNQRHTEFSLACEVHVAP